MSDVELDWQRVPRSGNNLWFRGCRPGPTAEILWEITGTPVPLLVGGLLSFHSDWARIHEFFIKEAGAKWNDPRAANKTGLRNLRAIGGALYPVLTKWGCTRLEIRFLRVGGSAVNTGVGERERMLQFKVASGGLRMIGREGV